MRFLKFKQKWLLPMSGMVGPTDATLGQDSGVSWLKAAAPELASVPCSVHRSAGYKENAWSSEDCSRWSYQSSPLHLKPPPCDDVYLQFYAERLAVTISSFCYTPRSGASRGGECWWDFLNWMMSWGFFFSTQSLKSHHTSVILSGWLNWDSRTQPLSLRKSIDDLQCPE